MNIRYISIIILIVFPLFASCRNIQDSTSEKETVDIALLDSTSIKIGIPYGREELIVFDFPEHWYCGGGYREVSLKEEGFNDADSIKYAQAYFSIIEFQRIDYNLGLQEVNLGDSIAKQIENNFGRADDIVDFLRPI